jgi:hypothetical protein
MSLKLNKTDTYTIGVKGSSFEVRPLSLSVEEKFLKKATKIKRGVEVVNNVAFLKDKFDAVVVGWDDIEIEGEKNPPCDRKSKNFVVEWFMPIVDEILQQTDEIRETNNQAEESNLGK